MLVFRRSVGSSGDMRRGRRAASETAAGQGFILLLPVLRDRASESLMPEIRMENAQCHMKL